MKRDADHRILLMMPPAVADTRSRVLDQIGPPSSYSDEKVAKVVQSVAGVRLGRQALHLGFESYDGARRAVVAVHEFGPPSEGSAEIVVMAERFAFTKTTLWSVFEWLLGLGINVVTARIASDDHRAQNFARRLGAKLTEPAMLDDGRLGSVWRIDVDAFLTGSILFHPARPVDAPTMH